MNDIKNELYKIQILELTTLFNKELNELRELLKKNKIALLYLVSYVESEEGEEFGLLLTAKKEIIRFVKTKKQFNFYVVEKRTHINNMFPEIDVALNL